eukprot:TRINITY_DN5148_c0_g1_i1.p1 TRINITY_DN5148_c0_g1~~TRINITY_DN5148_c0_g1_i1.p1  ORF type:complete len:677 (+),score=142.56 TRINITY_DN5148_c0_g1_i1:18-2048(+)
MEAHIDETLNADVVKVIFSFISPSEWVNVKLVSKLWKKLGDEAFNPGPINARHLIIDQMFIKEKIQAGIFLMNDGRAQMPKGKVTGDFLALLCQLDLLQLVSNRLKTLTLSFEERAPALVSCAKVGKMDYVNLLLKDTPDRGLKSCLRAAIDGNRFEIAERIIQEPNFDPKVDIGLDYGNIDRSPQRNKWFEWYVSKVSPEILFLALKNYTKSFAFHYEGETIDSLEKCIKATYSVVKKDLKNIQEYLESPGFKHAGVIKLLWDDDKDRSKNAFHYAKFFSKTDSAEFLREVAKDMPNSEKIRLLTELLTEWNAYIPIEWLELEDFDIQFHAINILNRYKNNSELFDKFSSHPKLDIFANDYQLIRDAMQEFLPVDHWLTNPKIDPNSLIRFAISPIHKRMLLGHPKMTLQNPHTISLAFSLDNVDIITKYLENENNPVDIFNFLLLKLACTYGHVSFVEKIINRIDLESETPDFNPLYLAAENSRWPVVKFLLETEKGRWYDVMSIWPFVENNDYIDGVMLMLKDEDIKKAKITDAIKLGAKHCYLPLMNLIYDPLFDTNTQRLIRLLQWAKGRGYGFFADLLIKTFPVLHDNKKQQEGEIQFEPPVYQRRPVIPMENNNVRHPKKVTSKKKKLPTVEFQQLNLSEEKKPSFVSENASSTFVFGEPNDGKSFSFL